MPSLSGSTTISSDRLVGTRWKQVAKTGGCEPLVFRFPISPDSYSPSAGSDDTGWGTSPFDLIDNEANCPGFWASGRFVDLACSELHSRAGSNASLNLDMQLGM